MLSNIKKCLSGSIKKRLYLLTGMVGVIMLTMVLVFIWAGNTLTMITAIERFERTHTLSRVEAFHFFEEYYDHKDTSDLNSFAKKWAITQSYNLVFGNLLEMRTTKSEEEFVDIVDKTFAEADRNTSEILVNRIHLLYWHPLIIGLVDDAKRAHELGLTLDDHVKRILGSDNAAIKGAEFEEIEKIAESFRALEDDFANKSGMLGDEISFIIKLLSVGMLILGVSLTGAAAFLTIRSISIPIGRFIAYSKEVAGGNLDAEMPDISGDELLSLSESMAVLLSLNQRLKADVDEKTQMANALRVSEERYRTLFESSNDAILLFDPEKGYLDCNPAALEMFAVSSKKAFCRLNPVFLSPEYQPGGSRSSDLAEKENSKAVESGVNYFEWVHKDINGRVFPAMVFVTPMELDGRTVLHCTIRDITERKQAEAEKDRLMTAINQAAEAIVITDVEGVIQYVNPAFEAVTGYSCEEAIGQTPRILKSGRHDDKFYADMWKMLEAGDIWSGRIVNRKKDGTIYTEEATISPVKDAAGKIVNFVAVSRDVTEEIKMEDQLRQSQKMQSIGQLVGGVAHDFNNLLQIINGYADVACAKLEPGHASVASLKEVSKAGLRAKDLVRQLLAFSRQQVIDPADLDLNEEIESSQKMLARLIGAHIRFRFIAGKDLGPVFADKGQINQVLMNLCVNARDAMPDGGTLTIETKEVSIAPQDMEACGLTRPGRYVLLSVADTGCGMDKKTCEKIFDPFFTTKEVGKGTGLGLSTVYGIVKQNEGHINVYSEPGQGTVFKIYLPVCVPLSAGVISSISENAVPAEDGIETILVVEDEEVVLGLATHFLRGAGYTVLTAKDGEEAVRVFKEHAGEIDLVMMDVVMPRMGGKAAMAEILKQRPALRHLFVSGYSQDTGHNDFIKEKHQHLLSKPYQSETLLRKIREVLDEE